MTMENKFVQVRLRRAASLLTCIGLAFIAACQPLTSDTASNADSNALRVHFIDVGQGGAQLIVGPTGKTMLIDGGNNSEEEKMVDYLEKHHIEKIDILIATHPDADHAGGLDAVIHHFDIGKIYMPKVQASTKTFEDVLTAIKAKRLKVSTAKAGLDLEWETDAEVQMIAPAAVYEETNEMSAVVRIGYGGTSFMLTGDAEAKSETDMLESGVNLQSDVLLVGHHGSSTSTSDEWLGAVKPQYAVIQSGDNGYGHPGEEVLERLDKIGAEIFRTDELGDIVITSDGNAIMVETFKNDAKSAAEVKRPDSDTMQTQTPYASCKAVKEAGKAPLHKGDAGYSSNLDRDGDGVACE